MPISLRDSHDIDELTSVLYDMLPGSGNSRLSFPTVAQQLGLSTYWIGGSKRPAIVALLTSTIERERHRFGDLIEGVVRQSVSWRARKDNPLTRDEIEAINVILARLGYKIPGLHDADFLARLARRRKEAEGKKPKDPAQLDALKAELMALNALAPRPRGFAFERFLAALFDFHGLAPRGSFRLKGEQIDGSFQDDGHTYLLEAKWQDAPIARAALAMLNETVTSKARWSRGLIISYSGFSRDGLDAFEKGRPVGLIAMDDADLFEVLDRSLSLPDILRAKARRAAETNRCFVRCGFWYELRGSLSAAAQGRVQKPSSSRQTRSASSKVRALVQILVTVAPPYAQHADAPIAREKARLDSSFFSVPVKIKAAEIESSEGPS